MPLPPSHDASRRRLRLLLWITLYWVVGIGLALAAFGTSLVLALGGRPAPAAILGLLGGLLLGAFRPQRQEADPPESAQGEIEAPDLVALVRGVAQRMGVRVPVEVAITPEADVSCVELGPFFGKGRRCRTEVGIGLIEGLSVAELEAFVAMHLCHQGDGDLRMRRLSHLTLDRLQRHAAIPLLGKLAGRYAARLASEYLEWDEFHLGLADEMAARAMGPIRYRKALQQTAEVNRAWELFLREEVQPLADEGYLPVDLFAGFRLFLEADHEEEEAEPIRERIARLAALELGVEPIPSAEGELPARTLLADPIAVEARLAELCTPRPRGEVKGQIRWDEVSERIWAPRLRKAALRIRRALPQGTTLGYLVEWLGHASTLALAIAYQPKILEENDPDRRQEMAFYVLRHGIAAWIGQELVARGWRWQTGPGQPLELEDPSGRSFAPMAWVGHALRDREAAGQLKEELAHLGLVSADEPAELPQQRASLLH